MFDVMCMSWVVIAKREAAEAVVNEAFGRPTVMYAELLARADEPTRPVVALVCNPTEGALAPLLLAGAELVCPGGDVGADGLSYRADDGGFVLLARAGLREFDEQRRALLEELGLVDLVVDEDATGELRALYVELGLLSEEGL